MYKQLVALMFNEVMCKEFSEELEPWYTRSHNQVQGVINSVKQLSRRHDGHILEFYVPQYSEHENQYGGSHT